MLDRDEYRKAWPKGLIKYPTPSGAAFSGSPATFIVEVGLPRGYEPEWQFSGRLEQLPPHGFSFGTYGVAPLVITPSGAVKKVTPRGTTIHLNESVEQFAACLTLRKKAGRSAFPLRTIEDVKRLREALYNVDESAVVEGSFWATYLGEVEREVREMTSHNT